MMGTPDFQQWSAQPPSPGFADGVVDAMLADRPQTKQRRWSKRWPGLVILAAALAGSAAWATLRSREAPAAPALVPAQAEEPLAAPPQPPKPAVGEPAPAPEPTTSAPKPAVRVVSAPPATPTGSASSPPAAPTPAPTMVQYPRCECQPHVAFCSCIE